MSGEKTLTTGQRIRFARQEAGWTQRQLSERTGVPQPQIARYEAGSSAPNAQNVDKIMTVLRNAGATVVLDSVDRVLGIQARAGGKLIPVTDLMAKPTAKEWFADGLVARRFVTALAGQEGSGKSMLAQTLAVAWARGDKEAFGFRLPGKQLRGLILDVENVMVPTEDDIEPSLVTERLQAYGMTAATAGMLQVVGCLGFDLDKDSDALDGVLSDARKQGAPYDYVILDSFRSLWTSGSENTPEAGRVLAKINRLAYTHDVAIIVLMHTNKAGAAYAGHTSIGSTVASLWTFSKMVHKNADTGKKVQHPTLRYLHPYKVRITSEPQSRIVNTSATGITSPKTADDYAGFVVDDNSDDEPGEGEA